MNPAVARGAIDMDDRPVSFLSAGEGPTVLLLHGTWWSRVWLPVVGQLAAAGLRVLAVDFPGCGRSGGELTLETATVPELAAWLVRFKELAVGDGPAYVAGHDIGGAVAQHILATRAFEVPRAALVNSVTYDSWPVSNVARYRDPATVAATTAQDIVAARMRTLPAALARPAAEEEIADYVAPWREPRVARSWMALAGAADSRYTLDLVERLRASSTPKLLIWGEDDHFQPMRYAERFVAEMPGTQIVRVAEAGHIPMENNATAVADALARFFNDAPRPEAVTSMRDAEAP